MISAQTAPPLKLEPVLTCGQTRDLEQQIADPAVEDIGDLETGQSVSLRDLMDRAGWACYKFISSHISEKSKTILILCGPGGNGGDGFVIARHCLSYGYNVAVWSLADPKPGSDTAHMLMELIKSGGSLLTDLDQVKLGSVSLVVDALFGAGLSRPFDHGQAIGVLKKSRTQNIPIFAVDVPSGLNGDTGMAWGECAGADNTLTFFTPKPGHHIAEGPELCGDLLVDDLGTQFADFPSDLFSVKGVNLPGYYVPGGHKYRYGHTLVFSGPRTRTGAARLAAMAALRMGSGLVTVASPENALDENAHHLTSIQLRRVDGPEDLEILLSDARYNTLVMGPGMGVGTATQALVRTALESKRQIVLDADALTSFEGNPQDLFDRLNNHCVLTPHMGEFRRVFPDIVFEDPQISKIDQVIKASKRCGAHILLKGPDTIIASPDGQALIVPALYEDAAPALATAGSGDILAGLIAGRLARDKALSMTELIAQATWIHQEIGRQLGPGCIAADMPPVLPALLKQIVNT